MNVNQAMSTAAEKWTSLSTPRKALIIGGAAVLLIGLILLGQFFIKDEYVPLFSELPSDEMGAVVDKLEEMNIPYKVGKDDGDILVPENILYKTRLQLASAGVLSGTGKGFELFDESQLGATDFDRRLNYQRALQEELRRTIVYLDEVENARVHINLPERSVFIEDDGDASASVVLSLKPLAELRPEQVKGIVHLISSSVENLPVENVNVIDTKGNILSEGIALPEDAKGPLHKEQMDLKREFEKNLETRVERMMEKILGPNRTVVMVTANLNFDQREVSQIEYGEDGVIRSEQLVEKSSISEGMGGVPGTAGNIGTYPAEGGGQQSSQEETDVTRNYEIDQIEERVVYAPGGIENLSTSVTVDGELAADEVGEIQDIVQAAVGYQPERGDQITVVSRTFDRSHLADAEREMEAAREELARKERLKTYMTLGAAGLGLLLIIILIFIYLRRRRAEREEEIFPMPVSEIAVTEEEEEEEEPYVPTEEEKRRIRRFDNVKEITGDNPEEAAKLVRAWLSED